MKAVGHGVLEMREHFGPGWRMYYVQRGTVLIVMLGGDDQGVMTMGKKIDPAGLPEFDLARISGQRSDDFGVPESDHCRWRHG